MKRFVRIPGHQYDGEQAEEPAEHSTEAVPGLSVHSTGVVDMDFAKTKAPVTGQHRYISMPLAVYHDFIQHFFSIALKAAVDVVEAHAGQSGSDPVVHPRGSSAGPLVMALKTPSRDPVVAFPQLLYDLLPFFRYFLKIRVPCFHKVVFRGAYSGRQRRRFAKVTSKSDVFHVSVQPRKTS